MAGETLHATGASRPLMRYGWRAGRFELQAPRALATCVPDPDHGRVLLDAGIKLGPGQRLGSRSRLEKTRC